MRIVFALFATIAIATPASAETLASLSNAVVKIRSIDPVSGLSATGSGYAFRYGEKTFVVSADHAVLNEAIPGVTRIVRFRDRIELAPIDTPPPEGGWPAQKIFKWIKSLDDKPIEIIDGVAWGHFEGEERYPPMFLPTEYKILFPSGEVYSAASRVSDWGRGMTLLEIIQAGPEVLTAPLLTWEELKLRMRSAEGSSVTIGGYPAVSRRLQLNPGRVDSTPYTTPTLAQIDVMTAVSGSFAEFGMSGGAAWDRQGNYVGLVSHISADAPPARKVLLIPGEQVREWLSQILETNDLNLQLFKDVSQKSNANWEAIYSHGVSFTLNCHEDPCTVGYDLSMRVNPTVSYPDHANEVVRIGMQRMRLHEEQIPSDELHVVWATVYGFRPAKVTLDEIGRSYPRRFHSTVEFFHLLRRTDLVPVVEWIWSYTTQLEALTDKVVSTLRTLTATLDHDLRTVLENRHGRKKEREARRRDVELVGPLLSAINSARRDVENLEEGPIRNPWYYSAGLIPTDFDAFFNDPVAIKAWEAIDRILPNRRALYEKMLKRARFELGDIVVDTAEDYKR